MRDVLPWIALAASIGSLICGYLAVRHADRAEEAARQARAARRSAGQIASKIGHVLEDGK